MRGEVAPLGRRNPARPQRRGERRREDILGALERLLTTSSLSAISIAEIAREAGTTRSAFYFYFANKQAAVFAMLEELFLAQSEEVSRILAQPGDRHARVAAVLGHTVHLWRDHRPLLLAALEARATDADAAASWDRWLEGYVELVAAFIEAERLDDLAPPGPDPELLGRVLIAANERMLERHLRHDEDEDEALELHRILVHVWTTSIYDTPLEGN